MNRITRRAILGALPAAAASAALPVDDAAAEEMPVHKVNRLGWELAEALNDYADGAMHAVVYPSDGREFSVGFIFTHLGNNAPATSDDLATIRDLIERHRATYLRWNELCHFADDSDASFDPAMVPIVDGLNAQEAQDLQALIDEPVTSFEALQAKGAHIAAIDARGGLGYEQALQFVRSFLNPNVKV